MLKNWLGVGGCCPLFYNNIIIFLLVLIIILNILLCIEVTPFVESEKNKYHKHINIKAEATFNSPSPQLAFHTLLLSAFNVKNQISWSEK